MKSLTSEAVKSLKKSGKESLVVAGSNNPAIQVLVNKINDKLGAYTTTINVNEKLNMFMSEDEKVNNLVNSVIKNSGPTMIMFYGTNPVYSHPNGKAFGEKLKSVQYTLSFNSFMDETSSLCKFVCPDHHALESWNDYNAKTSHYALAQPTIRPLHSTAAAQESLLVWTGKASRGGKDSKVFYDKIAANWNEYGFKFQTEVSDWDTYWEWRFTIAV